MEVSKLLSSQTIVKAPFGTVRMKSVPLSLEKLPCLSNDSNTQSGPGDQTGQ